ncbi:MAG TPA: hypothetical protein VJT31_11485 [Rugosimonospora sp.]|nr:hypothetical protein [Rugosimonospora sp.]
MGLKDLAAQLNNGNENNVNEVPENNNRAVELNLADDAFDAPMMIMNQIHEA